jgi:hypothetical protein
MTLRDLVTILVPVLVAVVSGLYAYLQTRKTSNVEDRKLDLSGYESLNKSQAAEIDRLRADRLEDQAAHRSEIEELRAKLATANRKAMVRAERLDDLMAWGRQVSRILNDPGIRRILGATDLHVPPMPSWPDDDV